MGFVKFTILFYYLWRQNEEFLQNLRIRNQQIPTIAMTIYIYIPLLKTVLSVYAGILIKYYIYQCAYKLLFLFRFEYNCMFSIKHR
jgi:hypothetical protein